jgi:hypothetical protein
LKKWGFEKNGLGKFAENRRESFGKCAEIVFKKCGTKFVKICEKVSHFFWEKFGKSYATDFRKSLTYFS